MSVAESQQGFDQEASSQADLESLGSMNAFTLNQKRN
jgi:hypothetical protein